MNLWIKNCLSVLKNEEMPSLWFEEERKNGNLKQYFPELERCFDVKQNKYHKYDVYYHLIYACDATPKRLDLRLSALFHDIGKPLCQKLVNEEFVFYNHEIISTDIVFNVLKDWEIDYQTIKKVTTLVRYHMFHYKDEWTDSAVRRILKKVGKENIEDLFLLRVADREGNGFRKGEPAKVADFRDHIRKIIEEESRFKITDLMIGGKDLMDLGMKPGREMGLILKDLYKKVISGKLENEKESLLLESKKKLKQESFQMI